MTKIGLTEYTAEVFEPMVANEMLLEASSASAVGARALTLRSVTRGVKAEWLNRQPFTLLLELKQAPPLAPGLHKIMAPKLEPVDLFITRVTAPALQMRNPNSMFYEIVFG